MGTFVISPFGQTAITCSMMADATTNYQVVPSSIDMNESARVQILYGTSDMGGSVNKTRFGIVPIKFAMIVFGTTQLDAMANVRIVNRALTNPAGGYLLYKPIGLEDCMTTYYRYLQSAPGKTGGPAQQGPSMERFNQAGRTGSYYVIVLDIELITYALATSDPTSPVTLVNTTTLSNHDDAGHDNSVVVLSSGIKGDLALPIITLTHAAYTGRVYTVHHRSMRPGYNTNLDWFEGESGVALGTNFSNHADAVASNENVAQCTTDTGTLVWSLSGLGMDSTYLGKVSILVKVRSMGGEYKMWASVMGVESEPVVFGATTINEVITRIQELDFPPMKVPIIYDDTTTPTIGGFLTGNATFSLRFEKVVSGGGQLEIDWATMSRSNDWIGIFRGAAELTVEGDMVIHAFDESAWDVDGGVVLQADAKYGPPYFNMAYWKGRDYRVRVIQGGQGAGYIASSATDVKIQAIWGTIYPFNEVA